MSSDTLTLLVCFLPTILALVIIALCMIRGIMRGFRKSLILLIHYILAIVAGVALYFTAIPLVFSDQLGPYFSSLGPNFADANSLFDVIHIFLEMYVPAIAGLTNSEHLQQLMTAILGLGINFILAIICLVVIPWAIRFLLYIVYLIFYPEGRVKRRQLDEEGDYEPHRFLGMLVGAARGVVCSVLTVSFITSAYFVLSGGITQTENTENVEVFDTISESIGIDINAVYKGLRQSRATGVGMLFELVRIDDVPVDLYYSDLFLSSTFTPFKPEEEEISEVASFLSEDEELQAEIAKLSVREELALLFKLYEDILETNAITIDEGGVSIDDEILNQEIDEMIDEYIFGSVVYTDLTPLAIIGIAEAINQGNLVVDDSIKELFDDDAIARIKKINFAQDMSSIFKIAIEMVELVPVNEEGQLDFMAFTDYNTLLNFDVEVVKNIFNNLSKISTLTEVVFPVGVGIAITSMEADIEEAGIDKTELDFSTTDWGNELANLGDVYEKLVALELDIYKLIDSSTNEETGLGNNIQYLIDLCNDKTVVDGVENSEKFKENLTAFVDTALESDFLSQIGLVAVKTAIANAKFEYEDGKPAPLNDALDLVKENLKEYNKDHLRVDLHELTSSCLDVTSLIPLFTGENIDIFDILYDIETEDVRSSLLGLENSSGNRSGGIYDLRIFNGDLDGDGNTDEGCKFATDSLIEAALKTYASEIISPKVVDSVTTVKDPTADDYDFDAWPNELSALIDGIADLQTIDEETLKGIDLESSELTDILPESTTNEDIDIITTAASKSKLLSGIIVDKLVTSLENDETVGNAVSDPDIVWMDTLIINENDEVTVKERGELNQLLKAFRIFSEEEKGMDINNTDSLINGLAQLLKPESENPESLYKQHGLDYEEAVYFANSQVLMTVLSKEVSKIGNDGSEGFQIVVPEKLNTYNNSKAWKYWSYDNEINYDPMNGEFAKLVLVLYHARERVIEEKTISGLADTEEKPLLNQDNLLDAVIKMNKDGYVVDSLVLYATMSNELMKQDADDTSVVKVRQCAKVPNSENNNGIIIDAEEIDKALDVVRYLKLDLKNNDFSDVNLAAVLTAIKDPADGEITRKSICLSNIFNISAVNKFINNDKVSVPDKFKTESVVNLEDSKWYPTSEANWAESELNQMMLSVNAMEIEATPDNKLAIEEDPTELIKSLTDDKLDVIYGSDVFKFTISVEVGNNVDLIRDEAYEIENPTIIKQEQISYLVKFLDASGLELGVGNIGAKEVFEAIKKDNVIEYISKSDIININVVDKLESAKDSLEFPKEYLNNDGTAINKEATKWYPATSDTWNESEIAKLLESVNELGITADNDGNITCPSNNTLLTCLNSDSYKENGQTKLDVVYLSDILSNTITARIEEQKGIIIRDIAYETNEVGAKIRLYQDEVSLLSTFLVESEINIDTDVIDAQHIFTKLQENKTDSTMRMHICQSNILNASTVDKIGGGKDENGNDVVIGDDYKLAFPSAYLNLDGTVKKAKAEWYPKTSDTWADCELNKVLISISDLNVSATGNTIDLPIEENMDILLADSEVEPKDEFNNKNTKLDVVYHSDIIAMTISRKLNQLAKETGAEGQEKSTISIPSVIYDNVNDKNISIYDTTSSNRQVADKIVIEDEVELLVNSIQVLGLTFEDNFELEDILSVEKLIEIKAGNTKTNLEIILESSIIHYTFSKELIKQKQTSKSVKYDIVTNTYWSDNSNEFDVVINRTLDSETTKYVSAVEIVNAVYALDEMEMESVSEASNVNSSYLSRFGKNSSLNTDERNQLIIKISSSAILSKIFSQILVDTGYANSYTLKSVTQTELNENVDVLSQTDLKLVLEALNNISL